MTFSVERVDQGAISTGVITVKGGTGNLCRPHVTPFPEGSTWALALYKDEGGEFFVSVCGVFWQEIALPLTAP